MKGVARKSLSAARKTLPIVRRRVGRSARLAIRSWRALALRTKIIQKFAEARRMRL
jgi:hypothetical protein